jgi:hypothetical protein
MQVRLLTHGLGRRGELFLPRSFISFLIVAHENNGKYIRTKEQVKVPMGGRRKKN